MKVEGREEEGRRKMIKYETFRCVGKKHHKLELRRKEFKEVYMKHGSWLFLVWSVHSISIFNQNEESSDFIIKFQEYYLREILYLHDGKKKLNESYQCHANPNSFKFDSVYSRIQYYFWFILELAKLYFHGLYFPPTSFISCISFHKHSLSFLRLRLLKSNQFLLHENGNVTYSTPSMSYITPPIFDQFLHYIRPDLQSIPFPPSIFLSDDIMDYVVNRSLADIKPQFNNDTRRRLATPIHPLKIAKDFYRGLNQFKRALQGHHRRMYNQVLDLYASAYGEHYYHLYALPGDNYFALHGIFEKTPASLIHYSSVISLITANANNGVMVSTPPSSRSSLRSNAINSNATDSFSESSSSSSSSSNSPDSLTSSTPPSLHPWSELDKNFVFPRHTQKYEKSFKQSTSSSSYPKKSLPSRRQNAQPLENIARKGVTSTSIYSDAKHNTHESSQLKGREKKTIHTRRLTFSSSSPLSYEETNLDTSPEHLRRILSADSYSPFLQESQNPTPINTLPQIDDLPPHYVDLKIPKIPLQDANSPPPLVLRRARDFFFLPSRVSVFPIPNPSPSPLLPAPPHHYNKRDTVLALFHRNCRPNDTVIDALMNVPFLSSNNDPERKHSSMFLGKGDNDEVINGSQLSYQLIEFIVIRGDVKLVLQRTERNKSASEVLCHSSRVTPFLIAAYNQWRLNFFSTRVQLAPRSAVLHETGRPEERMRHDTEEIGEKREIRETEGKEEKVEETAERGKRRRLNEDEDLSLDSAFRQNPVATLQRLLSSHLSARPLLSSVSPLLPISSLLSHSTSPHLSSLSKLPLHSSLPKSFLQHILSLYNSLTPSVSPSPPRKKAIDPHKVSINAALLIGLHLQELKRAYPYFSVQLPIQIVLKDICKAVTNPGIALFRLVCFQNSLIDLRLLSFNPQAPLKASSLDAYLPYMEWFGSFISGEVHPLDSVPHSYQTLKAFLMQLSFISYAQIALLNDPLDDLIVSPDNKVQRAVPPVFRKAGPGDVRHANDIREGKRREGEGGEGDTRRSGLGERWRTKDDYRSWINRSETDSERGQGGKDKYFEREAKRKEEEKKEEDEYYRKKDQELIKQLRLIFDTDPSSLPGEKKYDYSNHVANHAGMYSFRLLGNMIQVFHAFFQEGRRNEQEEYKSVYERHSGNIPETWISRPWREVWKRANEECEKEVRKVGIMEGERVVVGEGRNGRDGRVRRGGIREMRPNEIVEHDGFTPKHSSLLSIDRMIEKSSHYPMTTAILNNIIEKTFFRESNSSTHLSSPSFGFDNEEGQEEGGRSSNERAKALHYPREIMSLVSPLQSFSSLFSLSHTFPLLSPPSLSQLIHTTHYYHTLHSLLPSLQSYTQLLHQAILSHYYKVVSITQSTDTYHYNLYSLYQYIIVLFHHMFKSQFSSLLSSPSLLLTLIFYLSSPSSRASPTLYFEISSACEHFSLGKASDYLIFKKSPLLFKWAKEYLCDYRRGLVLSIPEEVGLVWREYRRLVTLYYDKIAFRVIPHTLPRPDRIASRIVLSICLPYLQKTVIDMADRGDEEDSQATGDGGVKTSSEASIADLGSQEDFQSAMDTRRLQNDDPTQITVEEDDKIEEEIEEEKSIEGEGEKLMEGEKSIEGEKLMEGEKVEEIMTDKRETELVSLPLTDPSNELQGLDEIFQNIFEETQALIEDPYRRPSGRRRSHHFELSENSFSELPGREKEEFTRDTSSPYLAVQLLDTNEISSDVQWLKFSNHENIIEETPLGRRVRREGETVIDANYSRLGRSRLPVLRKDIRDTSSSCNLEEFPLEMVSYSNGDASVATVTLARLSVDTPERLWSSHSASSYEETLGEETRQEKVLREGDGGRREETGRDATHDEKTDGRMRHETGVNAVVEEGDTAVGGKREEGEENKVALKERDEGGEEREGRKRIFIPKNVLLGDVDMAEFISFSSEFKMVQALYNLVTYWTVS